MTRRSLVLAALLSLSPLAALAADATVAAILADPAAFDGKEVTVKGTIGKVDNKISKKGNKYAVIELGDGGKNLHVFFNGASTCIVGQAATVTGKFRKEKKVGEVVYKNELEASKLDCE